jgi:autotransporter translocation and assembly factor TamB
LRFIRRASLALLVLIVVAVAGTAVLVALQDRLVAAGVRFGIDQYNARLNSILTLEDVSVDVLRLTVTVRGITVAERAPTPLGPPLRVEMATARVRLWPLIRRHLVVDEVAVSGVDIRLEIEHHRINLEELFRMVVPPSPQTPSPWRLSINRFAVDRAALALVVAGQPLQTALRHMAFRGFMRLVPLHVQAEMLDGHGEVVYPLAQGELRSHIRQATALVDVYRDRLAIQRLRVDSGLFSVAGQGALARGEAAAQFDAELDVALLSTLVPAAWRPAGKLVVQGKLAGPVAHPGLQLVAVGERLVVGPYPISNLTGRLRMAQGRVRLEHFALAVAAGRVQGSGTLGLAPPDADLQVEVADLSLAALLALVGRPLPWLAGRLAGQLRVVSPRFAVDDLRLEGQLQLAPPPAVAAAGPEPAPFVLPLSLHTAFRLAERTLTLAPTTWQIDGLKGELAGTQSLDGHTQLAGSLAADLAAPLFERLGIAGLQGEVQLRFSARGRLPEPHLATDIQVPRASYRGMAIGPLRLTLEAAGREVTLVALTGTQWGARYQVRGAAQLSGPYGRLLRRAPRPTIDSLSALQLDLEGLDLAKLAGLLPWALDLGGELHLRARGGGPWPDLRGSAQVDVRRLTLLGEAFGDASLHAEGLPQRLVLKRLIARVGGGPLQASGSVSLPPRLLDLTLSWQGVQLERLGLLRRLGLPVAGELSGGVQAHGAWPEVQATVAVQGPRLRAYGVDLAELRLQARASPRQIALESLAARVAGARLTATGRLATAGSFALQLASESIPLRAIPILPRPVPVDGRARLELTGSGTLAAPRLRGHVQLTGVRAGGLSFGSGALTFALEDRRVTVATAGLQHVGLAASVALDAPLSSQVRLELRRVDLGLVLTPLSTAAAGELAGEVSGIVELAGPLRAPAQLTGQILLDRLRLRSNGLELRNPAPLRWQLAQGQLRFERVQLQTQDARLDMRGALDWWGQRLDLTVLGTSPLAMLGTRLPGLRFQQGVVEAQLRIQGRLSQPLFDGRARLQDGAIYIAALNEHLSQLAGEMQFEAQTIAIQSLRGQLAGGAVGVSGEVRLRGLRLHELRLAARADQVRLRHPPGFSALLDAEIVAAGDGQRQRLTGQVTLSRARYRQPFDLAAWLGQFRQRALEPPTSAEESLQLDLRVAARDPVRVENRLVQLQLAPELHVQGSLRRPVLLGHMEIERGTAEVGGSRFTAIAGSVDLLNPTRTEPFFDVTADTQKGGYRIHVVATGTPQRLDLQLTSDPPLAEPDILAMLTVGAAGQAVRTGLTAVLPRRLSAFLTGQLAEEIGRGVGSLVGVDRLEIEPVSQGTQRFGGPKVTVGKDVSRNLSVTYSTTLGATQEDVVTVEYRLTDSLSILGVRDERGDVGVDLKYSIRFE